MKRALTIARREIFSQLVTPLFFVLCASYLILGGFFFFSLLLQFNSVLEQAKAVPETVTSLNEWVIRPFLETLEIVTLFLLPLLTMRLIAEERSQATFELLKTSPVRRSEIVLGKYLAFASLYAVVLLLAFVFPVTLMFLADPEVAPAVCGFLGLLLFGWALGALGLAVSSLTRHQMVAGAISLVLFLVLYLIDTPAPQLGGILGAILSAITPASHTDNFVKGVVESGDCVYFVSVIFLGLFLANRALDWEELH